jgi:hypothetical protein
MSQTAGGLDRQNLTKVRKHLAEAQGAGRENDEEKKPQ